MLTHGYWQRRFGGADPSSASNSSSMAGRQRSSACCLRHSSSFARVRDRAADATGRERAAHHLFGFQALARMKPGVTLAQANADVARMMTIVPPVFAAIGVAARTCARSRPT